MWYHALCVLALSACVTASEVEYNDIDMEINALQTAKKLLYKEADGCLLSDQSLVCDVNPDDRKWVPSGTLCFYIDKPGSEIICDRQEWKTMFNDEVTESQRLKRSHTSCVSVRHSGWWGRRRSRTYCTPQNHAPWFTSCPSVTKTTPSKATSMIVTWTTPTAKDDRAVSVVQTKGVHSGDTLTGSASGTNYAAYYIAKDVYGLTATCTVNIIVKVIVCPVPSNPKSGWVSCPNGRNYGWQCTFSCSEGYIPTIQTITCMSNGQWTDEGISECKEFVCPQQLPIIDNGHYVCDTYTYGSTCNPVCETAYDSTNYPISCTKNGKWTEPSSKVCKDSNPPTLLGCPTDITVQADVGMTSAIVTWVVPTASDSEDGTATVKQTIGSITPDQRVEGGVKHTIAYRAYDTSDNPSSECLFTVQVDVISCPAVSAPAHGMYSCSHSNLYGSQCSFTCHKGYQLQGTTQMQCEQTGLWDTSKPTCSEIVCYGPDQYGHSIQNGYYDCPSQITYQSSCTAMCNDGFQLQQTVTALCVVDSNNNPSYSIPQEPECIDNEPPNFPTCIENTVTLDAIKGTEEASVYYTVPLATDSNDPSPIVTKLSGPEVGEIINADPIDRVVFQAKDKAGNPSMLCVFILQVHVIECPVYIPPTHGEIICTADSIYGSVCTLRCNDGYQVNGLDKSECLETGAWSVNMLELECVEKACPVGPSPPLNGSYNCHGLTIFPYNLYCSPECDEGFTLQQTSSYARCQADQTWQIFNPPECRDSTPPAFTECVNTITVTADKQLTSAIVTWSEPVATDNVDTPPTVTQISGPSSGTLIEEGTTAVIYQAQDAVGNQDICEMEIVVEVKHCSSPDWTNNANIACSHGTLFGSLCQYSCDDGYNVTEPSTVECLVDGTWSYGIQPPTCSRITCNEPDAAANGIFYCSDTSYEYESVCYLHCYDGYSVAKPVGLECEKDGQWVRKSPDQCRDTVPPTLYNCREHQVLLLERGKDTAVANWIVPSAYDNVDSEEDITIELINGPEIGSNLNVGAYVAEHRAIDTAGNPSVRTCSITLTVEEVTCLDPKYSFDDSNLVFNCSSFRWGENCSLSCTTAASYEFHGADIITCEKTYWSYEGSEPYCEEFHCLPNLNTPINGAVTYNGVAQPVALVTCNAAFDLQYQFDGYSFCLDGGTWSTNPLPDCTRLFRPGLNMLDMEYYYEGNCTDPEVQEEIKSKMVQVLQTVFAGTAYDCLSDNTCGADNFVVECGNKRKRRDIEDHKIVKKETDSTVKVMFNLFIVGSVSSLDDHSYYEEELFLMYDYLFIQCENYECDIPGHPFVPGSMARDTYSIPECTEPGQVTEGFHCKSCAMGFFMLEFFGDTGCVECPIGTYNDHDSAVNCTSCPPGKSTLNIGSKSSDMCLDLCPAGFHSSSGLKPCTPCLEGYYKDAMGQGSCMPCIAGQTTFVPGQTSCSNYDVTLSGVRIVEVYQTTVAIDAITTLFWVLKDCESQLSTEFATSVLIIEISEAILINGNSVFDYTPYCDKWTHVAVSVDTNGYTLFINGVLIKSDTEPSMIQLPDYSDIKLGYATNTETSISSYAILARQLSAEEVSSYLSSCYAEFNDAILTPDDLIHRYEGIEANAPTCMAINHCEGDSPCGLGRHLCIPVIDGYICKCSDGYTGLTCDIPPDFCEENDCKNGATCISHESTYTCTCPLGFRGRFCQAAPVTGGWGDWSQWGTCSEICDGGVKLRTRVCDNPAPSDHGIPCSGDNLEKEDCNLISCQTLFPCSDDPCGEHTCNETATGFICECNPGYTGSLCQDVIDYCNPDPCSNAGTCISNIASFQCECPTGFSGVLCEIVTPPDSYWSLWLPCSVTCGGGTSTRNRVCTSGVSCLTTEESKECNDQPCQVDNCLPQSCNYHGVCISSNDDYSCLCETGYTGKSCDPVDFCGTNPCVHGQCSNTGTSYSCDCEEGFIGTLCETDADNGNWGEWTSWGSCNVTCGTGVRQRSRTCDNPSPGPGGLDCDGIATETTKCDMECYDTCSSNPCGIGHDCVEESLGYKCHCKHGYSGPRCLTPPDLCNPNPCDNGGLCRSNGDNPECDCINGYSGLTCSVHPDGSAWNPWSDWTECSVTCDGGSRSRTRNCTLGSQGEGCVGTDTHVEKCGQDDCPTCPGLPMSLNMKQQCTRNETEETVECVLSCNPGFFPPFVTVAHQEWSIKYICGPFTSYKWNTTVRTVVCSAGYAPKVIKLPVTMPLKDESAIQCSKQDIVNSQLRSLIDNVVCKIGPPCSFTVSVQPCTHSRRRKREVATEIEMVFSLDLSNYTGDVVDFWQVANKSLSPLVTTGATWLTVEVDGTTYVVDTTNFTDDADIECNEGFFLQEGYAVCAGCAPGSWFDKSVQNCQLCPEGMYQEDAGQFECDTCPDGYTTLFTGSWDRNDCTYVKTTDNIGSNKGLIIGASVGVVVAILAIIGVVMIIVFKAKRKPSKVATSLINIQEPESQRMQSHLRFRAASTVSASDIPVVME